MTEPLPDLHCEYGYASGRSHNHCAFVGRRWRDAYGTTLSDSDFYVCSNRPMDGGQTYTGLWGPWPNIVTSVWSSLAGKTYAGDASQQSVHIWDDVTDKSTPAHVESIWFAPEGIWGLDDQHVYAFGTGKNDAGDRIHPVAHFDGQKWTELPSPGFVVSKLHGIAPDLIYAAGRGGGMARWDGRGWTTYPMPTGEVLSDVFVAGPDEVYATGLNGTLLEGSANGWGVIARTIDDGLPFACVAKFADELWVGASFAGLYRRVGRTEELEHVKPNIKAVNFDARESLVITTPNLIAGTTDGQAFTGVAVDLLRRMTGSIDIVD